tara:strand:+ start:52 stop:378 length:327 start_codon:yes stop_codon:yes gene_type:complete
MRKDFRKPKKGNFKRYRREQFFVPGNGLAVKVPDSNPGTLEKALRYLKRQLKDDNTMMRLKEKRYYEKPSLKRSRIKNEAIRNQQYQERISKRYGKTCWTAIINGEAQ